MAHRQSVSRSPAALVAQVRRGRSVLAALLCGSLSPDTVWEKSDFALPLVTIDDGVNALAMLIPRAECRRMVEGSVQTPATQCSS